MGVHSPLLVWKFRAHPANTLPLFPLQVKARHTATVCATSNLASLVNTALAFSVVTLPPSRLGAGDSALSQPTA